MHCGNALFDRGEAQGVRIAQHRHHQALRRADRDADMVIFFVENVVYILLGALAFMWLERFETDMYMPYL